MGYGKIHKLTGTLKKLMTTRKFYFINEKLTIFSCTICQVSIKKQLSQIFQAYFQPLR